MPIDLFSPQVAVSAQHPIFHMMKGDRFGPERAVLSQWAEGFEDRDGKFVRELQTTFESSMWELYLFAAMREWGLQSNLRYLQWQTESRVICLPHQRGGKVTTKLLSDPDISD